jgi:hypothetical protein
MTARRQSQRGVTLLEALIAVALLAGIATLLAPAVYGALRASSAVIVIADANEQRRIVDDALTAIVSNAVVMSAADADTLMRGDDRSFETISLAGSGVARRFVLSIEGGRLLGEITPLVGGDDETERVEIASEGALRFSYYGRATEDAPPVWSGRWRSDRPPSIIRFEMSAGKSDEANFIFDIGVAGSGPLHCEFDPVSRRCRS